ncbi:hypothetical protein Taro_056386 [Colocasia esculenta]|uniref:Uncharacterized protein n=1 Tax=Colocasia esculenta TaxID=4460 RepID=A0A843XWB9_COLES|nr:hypothetical protein [Colocasia esculenta]
MSLCRVRGERGCSVCSCHGGAVGGGLAGSGLPHMEDAGRQVQGCCLWNRWKVPRRCWLSPCCWGVCCHCCVFGLVYLCAVVRCARDIELSRCLACCVALLVERCDTCLWLSSAWCWLVVDSSEVLLEFFSVGSDGRLFRARFCYCRAPQSLRCVFGWLVHSGGFFPERCLSGSGGGSPKTGLRCFCSPACCSVLSNGPCCLVVGLCILVKVLPRIALCRFWWRFFPGVLRVCFGPLLCCPCGSKCAVRLGCVLVRVSQDGSWRFWWRFSPKLLRVVLVVAALSLCRGELSSLPVGLFVLQSTWALSLVWLVVSKFLGCVGGTSCVPVVGWFASFSAPCVLL